MFALAAVASGQVPHQNHPPSSAEYAKVLEDPSRDEWQKPHDVVMALDLKSTETIADIGAGTGYFARRFALHAGKVYAVDIGAKGPRKNNCMIPGVTQSMSCTISLLSRGFHILPTAYKQSCSILL